MPINEDYAKSKDRTASRLCHAGEFGLCPLCNNLINIGDGVTLLQTTEFYPAEHRYVVIYEILKCANCPSKTEEVNEIPDWILLLLILMVE